MAAILQFGRIVRDSHHRIELVGFGIAVDAELGDVFLDDAMELDSVVEAGLDELEEVVRAMWSPIAFHFDGGECDLKHKFAANKA